MKGLTLTKESRLDFPVAAYVAISDAGWLGGPPADTMSDNEITDNKYKDFDQNDPFWTDDKLTHILFNVRTEANVLDESNDIKLIDYTSDNNPYDPDTYNGDNVIILDD